MKIIFLLLLLIALVLTSCTNTDDHVLSINDSESNVETNIIENNFSEEQNMVSTQNFEALEALNVSDVKFLSISQNENFDINITIGNSATNYFYNDAENHIITIEKDKGLPYLFENFIYVEELILDLPYTQKDLNNFHLLNNLKNLKLNNIYDLDYTVLENLTSIEYLKIDLDNIDFVYNIPSNKNLKKLEITTSELTNYEKLKKNDNLEVLSITNPINFNFVNKFPNLLGFGVNYNIDEGNVPYFLSIMTGLNPNNSLVTLMIYNANIETLDGIENFKNLEVLSIRKSNLENIKKVEYLLNLKSVNFDINKINSLEPLKNSNDLEFLSANYNNIGSLQGIENKVYLKDLYINSLETTDEEDNVAILLTLTGLEFYELNLSISAHEKLKKEDFNAKYALRGEH